MHLKKYLLATLLVTGVASAQSVDWTGLYLGVNAGYGFGKSNVTTSTVFDLAAGMFYFDTPSVDEINAKGADDVSAKCFTGGVTFGYNAQRGAIVYGGELDVNTFGLKAHRVLAFAPTSSSYIFRHDQTTKADYLVTLRARMGYAYGRNLFFGTLGLARTTLRIEDSFTDGTAAEYVAKTQAKTGFIFGAGYEYRLPNQWAIKGEILRVNFSKVTANGRPLTILTPTPPIFPGNAFTHSADLKVSILRLGLSHTF